MVPVMRPIWMATSIRQNWSHGSRFGNRRVRHGDDLANDVNPIGQTTFLTKWWFNN
jgi:hypothetical protein